MNELQQTISSKYEDVQIRIARAASISDRNANDINLVVVSKAQPVDVVQAAIDAGIKMFGENYPEETVPKKSLLHGTENTEWHMIGHLQSRKAKLIPGNFQRIHSIDSLAIAYKLNSILAESRFSLPALLEFNIASEASKSGWDAFDENNWGHLILEISPILELPNLLVDGIMVMPPLSDDEQYVHNNFERARALLQYLGDNFGTTRFHHLSMGTSADYEIAVQEGATFVRVGSAILGERRRE